MDLSAILNEPLGPALVALAGLLVLLILVVAALVVRQRRLGRRLDGLTRGVNGRSLEAVLSVNLERVHALGRDVERLAGRSAVQEAELRRAFQRIAIVRFNPFEDTGGNQSFAMALLDANGDGILVSSLHARGSTRVYAKAVKAGRSEAATSAEEAQALRQALAPPTSSRG